MKPRPGLRWLRGAGTQYHTPSCSPHLCCADRMEFLPSLHKLGISFQPLLFFYFFFVLIFKRGHCSFKELPRLAFVTGGEGGVVAEVGTQKNEIKRSTTKRS